MQHQESRGVDTNLWEKIASWMGSHSVRGFFEPDVSACTCTHGHLLSGTAQLTRTAY